MKDIHIFLNRLREDGGAIWLEKDSIRLSTSRNLQSEETTRFISENKIAIISLLKENNLFSKDQFLQVMIFRDNISTSFPLSPAQERLWFIEQFEQGSHAYHIPVVFELEMGMNVKGLKSALSQIVARHEVLRTTIQWDESREQGFQLVHDRPLQIEEVKLKNAGDYKNLVREDINRPFDLSNEFPMRIKFYYVPVKRSKYAGSPNRIYLLINLHHIAADGWSIEILEKELVAFYSAFISKNKSFALPELAIQYKDYAVWQRALLTGTFLDKQLSYWKKKLANYPDLKMPADYIRPVQVDYRGSAEKFTISKKVSRKLKELARRNDASLHSVMLSSISILFYKYTGQNDIVIGSPVANRHHRCTEDLIGFFVNMLVNRTHLDPSQSFEELVRCVHKEQIQAQQFQDLPFEKLVQELGIQRSINRHPVFQVVFAVQHFGNRNHPEYLNFSRQTLKAEEYYEVEKFDLSVFIDDSHEQLTGMFNYASSLFHKKTISALIDLYLYLLVQLTEAPDKPYSRISLFQPGDYKKIISRWNKTYHPFPKHKTLHGLFLRQSARAPNNFALVYEGQSLTYQQTDEKSNQLARYIRKQYKEKTGQELSADKVIALYTGKCPEMIIGMMGILKAGAAFVAIETNYPGERIDFILQDTGAALVLSRRDLQDSGHLKIPEDSLIYIGLEEKFYVEEDVSGLPEYSNTDDLAYIIYTSGTSGRPKGVKISHKSWVNLVVAQTNFFKIHTGSIMLQYASLVFDASVWEIGCALTSGAQLAIPSDVTRLDAGLLSEYLFRNKITIALLPPVLLSIMPYTFLPDLKTIVVGGDVCPADVMNKWSQGRKLINAYGPTEGTVITSMFVYRAGSKNTIIGKPVANIQVYVLDNNKTPVPVGITGELYIGGEGLALGYLNNEGQTRERFIQNPFSVKNKKAKVKSLLYKTGDLVRWLPDGNLEYIGRNDDQVKIRGMRVELGEIEHALLKVQGIKQCCVLARDEKPGQVAAKSLVGYYVADQTSQHVISSEWLSGKLLQVLPEYMVPVSFMKLESFPLTSSGKIDKLLLPDIGPRLMSADYKAPSNEFEKKLCVLWEKLLGLDRVGITDDFFRIGGHSILAIQLCIQMSKILGYELPVAGLFRLRNIENIAAGHGPQYELVRPFLPVENKDLINLIFIHPGHGGAEVYQNLAELLSTYFNCIGIDNYNFHYKEKIRTLSELSRFYLHAYEKKYRLTEPVYLLGWSLGGLIALEMASILETKGYNNINVILLDTSTNGVSLSENARSKKKKGTKKGKPATSKVAQVIKTNDIFETEVSMAQSPVSRYLHDARVLLLRAANQYDASPKNGQYVKSSGRLSGKSITGDIHRVAANVKVINLNCDHWNILQTNSINVCNYILVNMLNKSFPEKPEKKNGASTKAGAGNRSKPVLYE